MDVLITGAGGRIGSQLARILHAEGHTVRGLGLTGDMGLAALSREIDVSVHEGDLTDPASLVRAVSGVDAICHLAAALTTHDVEDDLFVDVNYRGTYNLLVAARDHAPDLSRFIYTSSDAVYWPALTGRPLYLPVDESHPLMAGSVYGATKVGAEAMCRAFSRTYGVPFVVMRPTATASPDELVDPASPFGRRWFLSSAIGWLSERARDEDDNRLLEKMRAAAGGFERLVLVTDSEGVASSTMITDSRDVARAVRFMIDSPEALGEAFNVGPAAPHSDRVFLDALAEALDIDVVEIAHGGVRPSWYVSSGKARQHLGYEPQYTVFDMIAEATGGAAA